MFWYVIQLFLLVLAAVVIGLIIGCLLRSRRDKTVAGTAAQPAVATASSQKAQAVSDAPAQKSDDATAAKTDTGAERKADEEAKKKAEAEAEKKADEEARKKVEAEARKKAEADAKKKAEAEAKKKAEADARKKAEAEAGKQADAPAKKKTAAKKATPKKTTATAKKEELSEADVAARLAELPKDATSEQKADAVGSRPAGLSAPTGGEADDLKRIKGIGKVNEKKLGDLGIYHFDQIAKWSAAEARWVGTFLSFMGRIEREDWIGQAKVLAGGGDTVFSKRVDDGDVPSSR